MIRCITCHDISSCLQDLADALQVAVVNVELVRRIGDNDLVMDVVGELHRLSPAADGANPYELLLVPPVVPTSAL